MYYGQRAGFAFLLPCLLAHLGDEAKMQQSNSPKAVVLRAIEAHGGRAALLGARRQYIKAKGTDFELAGDAMFLSEKWLDLPGRLKQVSRVKRGNEEVTETLVTTDKTSWLKSGDLDALEVSDRFHQYSVQGLRMSFDLTFVPLVDDKNVSLESIDELVIDGKSLVGVRVVAKGRRPLDLFFDKETYLLSMLIDTADRSVDDLPTVKAFFYDYKDFSGLKIATRRAVFNGTKKVQERVILEVEQLKTVDPALFEKPK